MGLPGAVNRHHLVPTSLESLHDSAERYIDNVADATDALLKAAKVTTFPDVYLAIPKPSVGMATVHGGHFYVCVTLGSWTLVV